MKKVTVILFLLSFVHLSGQEIITLEYDNSGLDYREAEIKKKGYSGIGYNFKNISIPTLQVFLPEGKSLPTTAMVVCPGGGMRPMPFSTKVWMSQQL